MQENNETRIKKKKIYGSLILQCRNILQYKPVLHVIKQSGFFLWGKYYVFGESNDHKFICELQRIVV